MSTQSGQPFRPSSSTPAPTRANARSGTGGPLTRTARPIRVEALRAEPAISGRLDPLAPVSPWGVEPAWSPSHTTNSSAQLPLSDMIDRASAQVVMLRRAVEDAAGADRIVRQNAAELAQRLAQGQRFAADFDQRLIQAGQAASVLDKAVLALKSLESVVEQMRAANDTVSRSMNARLRETEQRFEQRLADMQASFDAAIARVQSQVTESRKGIEQHAEQVCATVDRHAAQAQARVSIILDSASDRLQTMEDQLERLGGETMTAVHDLCGRAATLLGHDPRTGTTGQALAAGSLAAAVRDADDAINECNSAVLRVAVAKQDALATTESINQATHAARQIELTRSPLIEQLRTSMDEAISGAERARQGLVEVTKSQEAAIVRSDEASALLARQREDLKAIAEATRYHIDQARTAQNTLEAITLKADDTGQVLKSAMQEVTVQAASLVELARKVTQLVRAAQEPSSQRPADDTGPASESAEATAA